MDIGTLNSKMYEVIQALWNELQNAWSAYANAGSPAGVRTLLLQSDGLIRDLQDVKRVAVLNGRWSEAQFHARAQLISNNIASAASISNSAAPSVSRFYNEVVAQSGKDLAKKVEEAVPVLGAGLGLTAMIVLGVAAIYITHSYNSVRGA